MIEVNKSICNYEDHKSRKHTYWVSNVDYWLISAYPPTYAHTGSVKLLKINNSRSCYPVYHPGYGFRIKLDETLY